jgi:hypothetical protein
MPMTQIFFYPIINTCHNDPLQTALLHNEVMQGSFLALSKRLQVVRLQKLHLIQMHIKAQQLSKRNSSVSTINTREQLHQTKQQSAILTSPLAAR